MSVATLEDTTIELPLLSKLLEVVHEIENQAEGAGVEGIEALDLRFHALHTIGNYGYYCTPKNSLSFASTGVDGEHFSFLGKNGRVHKLSPVIFTG